jgi:membrane protein implicated in regulation of membrane protease activity
MLTSVYVWDIFWLVACLVFATALRVWITASWLMFALAGFLVSVVISPVVSFELSIYMVAYFKTCCIYFLLVLQQKIARRDINDRGYEVHQNQFNIIYRRVLHAGK